jgi:hypothetical protein
MPITARLIMLLAPLVIVAGFAALYAGLWVLIPLAASVMVALLLGNRASDLAETLAVAGLASAILVAGCFVVVVLVYEGG